MQVPVRREPPDGGPEFRRMRERLLADLERWPQLVAQSRRAVRPHTALEEEPDAYLVDVDLPGVPADAVEVAVGEGRLVVTGRRPGRSHVVPERSGTVRRYRLEVALPVDADPDGVEGVLELGVLQLRVPRRAGLAPRRIPVRRRAS